MLSSQEAHSLLMKLCDGGYCVRPEVRERLQTAPPETAVAFASAVLRAEGLDPNLDSRQYRWVLELVEAAFQRSKSVTSDEHGT